MQMLSRLLFLSLVAATLLGCRSAESTAKMQDGGRNSASILAQRNCRFIADVAFAEWINVGDN